MTQRRQLTPTTLEVRLMFEPGRVAAAYLVDAYARLVPIRRRPLRSTPRPQAAVPDVRSRRAGGDPR